MFALQAGHRTAFWFNLPLRTRSMYPVTGSLAVSEAPETPLVVMPDAGVTLRASGVTSGAVKGSGMGVPLVRQPSGGSASDFSPHLSLLAALHPEPLSTQLSSAVHPAPSALPPGSSVRADKSNDTVLLVATAVSGGELASVSSHSSGAVPGGGAPVTARRLNTASVASAADSFVDLTAPSPRSEQQHLMVMRR